MLRKTAIVTGGFGDIGMAIAKKFAQNGFNVALTYLNTFSTDFINELKGFGVDVLALRCNQCNASDVINFVNSVKNEFESIDVCVCCAGKAESVKILPDKDTDEIDNIISTNLRGTILFNREVGRYFLSKRHGNIINISSFYGEYGGSMEAVYSACKAGVDNLTKSLAVELAPYVRVNAVAPGMIFTKMTNKMDKTTLEYVKNQTPLKRFGTPEDVANAVYFLASDDSSFITGNILTVSGGYK